MKSPLIALILGLLLVAGCKEKTKPDANQSSKTNDSSSSSGNPISAPVDYLGAVGKAGQKATASVEALAVKNAIQSFYAQEERYPKDLQEMVKMGYIREIPKLPAGKTFSYNPASGEVKVQ